MRRLVSILLSIAFVSVVPALAAAELSMPESCCAPSSDGMLMAVSCCAVASCSMSSRPEPVQAPNHKATTSSESGQKLPAPKPVITPVGSFASLSVAGDFVSSVELLDPSPPPTTSERLAFISCYLI